MNRGLIVVINKLGMTHWERTQMSEIAGSPRLLTVEQFAERANLGRTTAYAMVASGEIASVKIGRLRRIPVEALDEYVARLLKGQVA